jgi:hypothetical protein
LYPAPPAKFILKFKYVNSDLASTSVTVNQIIGSVQKTQKHVYQWNHKNQLIQHDLLRLNSNSVGGVLFESTSDFPTGMYFHSVQTVTYKYDALGTLISKRFVGDDRDFHESYVLRAKLWS